MLPSLRLEAAFFALLGLTALAIIFEDALLKRSLTIDAQSGNYAVNFYGDEAMGGNSDVRADPGIPLAWSCELRDQYAYPYCGYELLFDGERRQQGIDLRRFKTITLALSYDGPAEVLRLHLKNADPRYSRPSLGEGDKFNKIEFLNKGENGTITLDLDEFTVAEWWLVNNEIPPELAQPEFHNIVSLEVQTGSGHELGGHRFRIHSVRMEGSLLSPEQFYLSILGVWVAAIGLFVLCRMANMKRDIETRRRLHAEAERQADKAEQAARVDPLTGLLNRAGISDGYRRLAEQGGPISAILIDIDFFKQLNDQFGHSYGDEVLASFAAILKRNARAGDVVGRWGGEEFLILCAGLDHEKAIDYASRMRSRIEHFHFGAQRTVTASFGVQVAEEAPFNRLVRDADVALYAAKRRGRNQVVLFGEGLPIAA